jgi:excisionase family DNA binding protein
MSEVQERLLSAKEAVAKLGISKPTLCRIMQRGEIGFYRVGTRVLFSEEHKTTFLKACEHKPLSSKEGGGRQ